MEFSRQKYWSRVPFPSSGDCPDPGTQPRIPTLQADSFSVWVILSEPPNVYSGPLPNFVFGLFAFWVVWFFCVFYTYTYYLMHHCQISSPIQRASSVLLMVFFAVQSFFSLMSFIYFLAFVFLAWGHRSKKTLLQPMASGPTTSWQINGETVETVADFILGAPKSLQMVITAMKLKDAYSLEGNL